MPARRRQPRAQRQPQQGLTALTVALLYACFAALWIVLSDRLVLWLFTDPEQAQLVSTLKGWAFVLLTALLIYGLLRPTRRPPLGRSGAPRLPWFALGLIALVVSILTGLVVYQAWRNERQRTEEQLLAISASKAGQVAEWFRDRQANAQDLQRRTGLADYWRAWRQNPSPTTLAPLEQRLRGLTGGHVKRIALYDAQQALLWQSDGPDLGREAPLRAALTRALADNRPQHAGPWRDAGNTLRLAFVALIGEPEQARGLVVLHTDPDEDVHPALQGWPLPNRSAEAFLFTRDGDDVLFLSDLRYEAGAAGNKRLPLASDSLFTARVLRGEVKPGELLDGVDYRGVPSLAMAWPVGDSGWWMLAKEDRAELMQRALGASAWMVVVGVLAIVSMGVGLYLVLQRRQLRQSALDIEALRHAKAELLKLSQATEQSPASVIITGLDACIEYVNQAFERISGYQRAEVLGQNPRLLGSGRTPRQTYEAMWSALRRGEAWSGEIINRTKSGHDYVQAVTIAPVRDGTGKTTHYVSVQLDVTAQRRAEEQAHRLAWFDPLTGLANRHRLLDELAGALAAARRTGRHSALLLINLDRFKRLNDALGHQAGDALLRLLGARLQHLAQPGDVLARLSADEFALLRNEFDADTGAASALALRGAQLVHQALAEPFAIDNGETLNVGASVGVCILPAGPDDTPGEVLRRADTALHRAKAAGGHQSAFFDPAMGQVVSERFAIEQDLRRGLAAGELRLYLQPQVDATGAMVSAEALVRWQHPEQGLVPPGVFIPVAEESDLIAELGDWVLGQVCGCLGELRRQGRRLPISVNVSPRQFHRGDFVARVLRQVAEGGAAPSDLMLEITEGVLVDEVEQVIHKMTQLTRQGVMFSIDDFGTGYSSLAYLKRLPIHELKIDKGFVQDAPRDANGAAVVEAILSVARHLRLKVVAEGVETREQADFLNARGEVIHQGYLFGRPEPAADLLKRWESDQMGAGQEA